MRSPNRKWAVGAASVAALGLSSIALGLPWDLDMADTQAVKGYRMETPHTPAGAVAQPNLLSPTADAGLNYKRGSAESSALAVPQSTPESRELGDTMYQTYCSPCHGSDGVNLGPVAQPGRYPGVVPLAGAAGIAKLRDDTWIYLTIRNGGAVMPSYSWAMSDEEMWSIVHYVRTLSGAAYKAPEPAEDSP